MILFKHIHKYDEATFRKAPLSLSAFPLACSSMANEFSVEHNITKKKKTVKNDIWTYVTLLPASGSSSQPVTKAQHEAKVCYWIKTTSFSRIKQVPLYCPLHEFNRQLKRF